MGICQCSVTHSPVIFGNLTLLIGKVSIVVDIGLTDQLSKALLIITPEHMNPETTINIHKTLSNFLDVDM